MKERLLQEKKINKAYEMFNKIYDSKNISRNAMILGYAIYGFIF